jgi:hypothetical protein
VPALERLEFLVGELSGREEVTAGEWAEGGSATARARGELALDGGVLVQHHVHDRDGATFRTLNVFMVDPATGEVLLYAFDSAGYPPEPAARGTWRGEELVLGRTTERGSARTTFSATADGYRWSKEFRAPGADEWSPLVEGELHRT